MLIRELDALLISFPWVGWFALITAVLALIRPVMHFRATIEQLAKNIPNPRYGILLSGLLAVAGLLRLFGMQVCCGTPSRSAWLYACRENAGEEGSESFGYMVAPAASLRLLRYLSLLTHDKIISSQLRRETARGNSDQQHPKDVRVVV